MPIRNVVSTLPDEPYTRALEVELAEIRAELKALRADVSNLNRGRA